MPFIGRLLPPRRYQSAGYRPRWRGRIFGTPHDDARAGHRQGHRLPGDIVAGSAVTASAAALHRSRSGTHRAADLDRRRICWLNSTMLASRVALSDPPAAGGAALGRHTGDPWRPEAGEINALLRGDILPAGRASLRFWIAGYLLGRCINRPDDLKRILDCIPKPYFSRFLRVGNSQRSTDEIYKWAANPIAKFVFGCAGPASSRLLPSEFEFLNGKMKLCVDRPSSAWRGEKGMRGPQSGCKLPCCVCNASCQVIRLGEVVVANF